ncbi:MAG TPA: Hsp70 family protein [Polyangia bacterium]|nr:Hsp70 family protein [Polyangia bacterium]
MGAQDPVIGIDLGTSNSVVAVVQDGKVVVIPDGEGRRVHPSVVSFHSNGTILVGEKAKRRRIIDPRNTVFSAKRLIGRRFLSAEVRTAVARMPYTIKEGPNQQPIVEARGKAYTIPEVSAMVLTHMKTIAEHFLGRPVGRAVVTVPANFNDAQREATKAAGRLAQLEVVRILNEPTAAALAYGYGKGLDRKLAIYDFGGGTFDITVLLLRDRIFEVLSTAGDTYLGGDDIDLRLVDYMVQAFLRMHRVDLRSDGLAMERLRSVAEQVKCQLSARSKAVVQIQEIAHGVDGRAIDLSFSITRDGLNQKIVDIIDRTFIVCDEALRLAGHNAAEIDDIVLVGGTTKMPLVRERVATYYGRDPRIDINPDEVVAVGAAIQAAALMQDVIGPGQIPVKTLLLDVTPRALGIGTLGGYAETIIQRNAQIPTEQTRLFTTSYENQTTVKIQVCQGESRRFEDNTPLGELSLSGLQARPRGEVTIGVTFEINTDGILSVRARDQATGKAQSAKIQVLGTMTEEEIKRAMMANRDRKIASQVDEDAPTAVHR